MSRCFIAALWVLALAACHARAPKTQGAIRDAGNGVGARDAFFDAGASEYALVVMSDPAHPDVQPKPLPFEISRVYRNQRSLKSPPWHANGGDWLFFDAKTPGGAFFIAGLAPHQPSYPDFPNNPNAVLATPDKETSQKIGDELARTVALMCPDLGALQPIGPVSSVLKKDAKRSREGEHNRRGGDWVTLEWGGPAGPKMDTRVCFNFSLRQRTGEFVPCDEMWDWEIVQ